MCGGNRGPKLERVPTPPPEKELMDFINHITGTKTVTVIGPNGKPHRETIRIPRKPEEEERYKFGEQLVASTLKNLVELNKYDPQSLIPFQPLLDAYYSMNNDSLMDIGKIAGMDKIDQDINDLRQSQRMLLDEQFDRRERALHERLAQTGRGTSSYAIEARNDLARQRGLANAEGDMRAREAAIDLTSKRLNTDTNAFNLRQQGRAGSVHNEELNYQFQKEDEQDQERRRLQAMQETQGLYNVGAGILQYDDNRAMQDRTADQSLATYATQNNVQNQRYANQVAAVNANNNAAIQEYKNRPPSFGEMAAGLVGQGAMAMFTARPDTMAGRLGKKFF